VKDKVRLRLRRTPVRTTDNQGNEQFQWVWREPTTGASLGMIPSIQFPPHDRTTDLFLPYPELSPEMHQEDREGPRVGASRGAPADATRGRTEARDFGRSAIQRRSGAMCGDRQSSPISRPQDQEKTASNARTGSLATIGAAVAAFRLARRQRLSNERRRGRLVCEW
jgi:hypothetical protein